MAVLNCFCPCRSYNQQSTAADPIPIRHWVLAAVDPVLDLTQPSHDRLDTLIMALRMRPELSRRQPGDVMPASDWSDACRCGRRPLATAVLVRYRIFTSLAVAGRCALKIGSCAVADQTAAI